MKKFFKIFIPLVVILVLAYQFRIPLGAQSLSVLNNFKNNLSIIFPKVPCVDPIPYTLGTFDTKFGISEKYFQSALIDAEAIWEKPQGKLSEKQLFVYVPKNPASDVLKINLIYDYRQQATSKLASLGITVKNDRTSYDMLKAKFTTLKTQYDKEKTVYTAQLETFNTKQQAYETEVNYWNSRGGAAQDEYNKLQAEEALLKQEASELQSELVRINAMVDEINALVVALNRLVTTLNLSVDQYNTVNGARGESFEEGVYVENGSNKEIDIYEFSSRAKLVRVLAHELGHALGLDHVDDPKAIMYRLNQGSNMTLTNADLLVLKTRCKIK